MTRLRWFVFGFVAFPAIVWTAEAVFGPFGFMRDYQAAHRACEEVIHQAGIEQAGRV